MVEKSKPELLEGIEKLKDKNLYLRDKIEIFNISDFKIDRSVSEKIKKLYLNDLENKLNMVEKYIKRKSGEVDLKDIIMIAHTYKGNAEYFGLKCLESVSIELDGELREDLSDIRIINLLEKIVNIIKNIIKYNS